MGAGEDGDDVAALKGVIVDIVATARDRGSRILPGAGGAGATGATHM